MCAQAWRAWWAQSSWALARVGWFGFNAGSALAANGSAAMTMLVTHIAAATAGLSWMLTEWVHKGKPTVLGIVSGAISGLVVITPGAGYVDQTGAFVMGLASSPVSLHKRRLAEQTAPSTAMANSSVGSWPAF